MASDLHPLGDLGVRNGMAKVWDVKGSGTKGRLDEKRDAELLTSLFEDFKPYRSIARWYMWRALESVSYDEAMK